jgi:16S rRNA (uracil1498-N3)-methyltransferase
MSERFFCDAPIHGELAQLNGPEAHHLLHVIRARPGDRVTLFDGSGAEFVSEIAECGRSTVDLRVLRRREMNRELPFPLVVGVSLPKGDRQKWLVEKLTELGVTMLVPIITERGVAQPSTATLDRLRRSVIEASKQCGRNCLMQIAPPESLSAWIWTAASSANAISGGPRPPKTRRLIAHPTGQPLASIDLSQSLATHIAVGPEGGFTDVEAATAQTAWQTVDLGPRILRVETAAVALAAVVAASAQP